MAARLNRRACCAQDDVEAGLDSGVAATPAADKVKNINLRRALPLGPQPFCPAGGRLRQRHLPQVVKASGAARTASYVILDVKSSNAHSHPCVHTFVMNNDLCRTVRVAGWHASAQGGDAACGRGPGSEHGGRAGGRPHLVEAGMPCMHTSAFCILCHTCDGLHFFPVPQSTSCSVAHCDVCRMRLHSGRCACMKRLSRGVR